MNRTRYSSGESSETSSARMLGLGLLSVLGSGLSALASPVQQAVSFEDTILHQVTSGSSYGDYIVSGEVNGDGHVDLAVVDSTYNLGGRGWVLLGPDFQTKLEVDLNEPQLFDYLGSRHGAWVLDDVTGDGLDDLLVSSQESYAGTDLRAVGRAMVVPAPNFDDAIELLHPEPAYSLEGVKGLGFGSAMLAHDCNCDGIQDVLVGAANMTGPNGESSVGAIYVFDGTRLDEPHFMTLRPPAPFTQDRWGTPMLKADVDEDGALDLLTGEAYTHPVYGEPFFELAMAWHMGFDHQNLVSWPVGHMLIYEMNTQLVDLDLDGELDYLGAGFPLGAQDEVRWSYGPDFLTPGSLLQPTTDPSGRFGDGLAVGDFNRDGIPDIAVSGSDMNNDEGEVSFGRIYITYGPGYELGAYFEGAHKNANLGTGLHVLDLNGDGFDELLAGAGSEEGGRLHLYQHHTLRVLGDSTVSVAAGGTVELSIEVGPLGGDQVHILAVSGSGSEPGVSLSSSAGPVHVPLNPDSWTETGFALIGTPVLEGFLGTTDSDGNALAKLELAPGQASLLAGSAWTLAAVLIDPVLGVTYATESVEVQFTF